jgi:hypothetical protein
VDGKIRANGGIGGNWSGAAGGSVHIEAQMLSGVGRIEALGGNVLSGSSSLSAGGGGRISVYVEDAAGFAGSYDASGGANATTNVGGTGTVFIRNPNEPYGHLIIDNNLKQAQTGSTVIEHVGRHLITGVTDLGDGRWQVNVGTSAWTATNTTYDFGVQGLTVDLDRADATSLLYTIESNTANALIISTPDDLSGYAGKELIGVHRFSTLNIGGGASVDFGNDRIEVQDTFNSQIDAGSLLNAGPGSVLP